MSADSAEARETTPQPGAAGMERTLTMTGTKDAAAWTKSRFAKAVTVLEEAIPTLLDVDSVAEAVVAHWAIETGYGSAEYNFNVGNIKTFKADVPFVTRKEGKFRAFASLDDGIGAYAKALADRYPDCVKMLLLSPEKADWYDCLHAKGYMQTAGDICGTKKRVAELRK